MSTSPFRFQIPSIFKRLNSQHNDVIKHWIALREKKQYRHEHKSAVIQGLKTIKELQERGVKLKALAVTVTDKKDPQLVEIEKPASTILQNPDYFPSKKYYVTDVNMVRRILGTASRPGLHEVFAEVEILNQTMDWDTADNLLVCDKIKDPGNLGTLIRTAIGLDWTSGLLTGGTCDLYNDKTIRASRALSLAWKSETLLYNDDRLVDLLKEKGFTPVVADMLPKNENVWSPEHGEDINGQKALKQGTGVWFWNFKNKPTSLPKKVALILCSEHHGVSNRYKDEIRVSVPISKSVESLNVAHAGSIIMSELNRLLYKK